MSKAKDNDRLHEIVGELTDPGSSFYDLVAEELAKYRGVPLTDEIRNEVREMHKDITVDVTPAKVNH